MGKHYEIKVSIRDTHPPTWRRIKVPAKMTFNELAAVLELAFEWLGGHLYQFGVGNPYLSSKEGAYPEDFGGLYGCEQMGIGGGDAPYLEEINEEIECYKEFAKQIYSK